MKQRRLFVLNIILFTFLLMIIIIGKNSWGVDASNTKDKSEITHRLDVQNTEVLAAYYENLPTFNKIILDTITWSDEEDEEIEEKEPEDLDEVVDLEVHSLQTENESNNRQVEVSNETPSKRSERTTDEKQIDRNESAEREKSSRGKTEKDEKEQENRPIRSDQQPSQAEDNNKDNVPEDSTPSVDNPPDEQSSDPGQESDDS